jgi:hypothetical protein
VEFQSNKYTKETKDGRHRHRHRHRYRVHVPTEIGPGEEFFVTLPHNGRQARLIAPFFYYNKLNTTVLEFQTPPDDPREPTMGYECCRWKVLERAKKKVLYKSRCRHYYRLHHNHHHQRRGGASVSEFPYLLTHSGTLPAILTIPSPQHHPEDEEDGRRK